MDEGDKDVRNHRLEQQEEKANHYTRKYRRLKREERERRARHDYNRKFTKNRGLLLSFAEL